MLGVYFTSMGVELVKLVGGKEKLTDTLLNHTLIACSSCSQTYHIRYSNGESSRLKEWLAKAQAAVDGSHGNGHSTDSMPVAW